MILGAILLILGGFGILYVSATLTMLLADFVGATAACAIVAALHFLACALIYAKRTAWIVNPVTRFVAGLVLSADEAEGEA